MMAFHYVIDTQMIEIKEANQVGHYAIHWEGQNIGFIFISNPSIIIGKSIWHGNTPYLDQLAAEIGLFIEESEI